MQPYRSFKLSIIAFTLLTISGCNDFLDENPDNRVTLNTLEKASQLLVNAYSKASPAFTEWMTDNVQFTAGTTKRLSQQQLYAWQDVTVGPTEQDTPDYYWFQTYDAIAHANEVLSILEDLEVTSSDDAKRKDAIEAEALLTRAYGHFMLVNMFGAHYGSSETKGIPYVKKPETTFLAEYRRKSVNSVYSDIEDDLLAGLEKVDDSFYKNSGKYHFNRNAALAFASRFYLYQRDFIRCIQYSNELLGSNPSAFVRDLTSPEFKQASSSTTEYPRLYNSPDHPANLLLMRKVSLIQRPDFAYGPASNFYNSLFAASLFSGLTDERENPAFVKGLNAVMPVRFESLFERSSLNSSVGSPYYIHMAFTGEEVLLNRAEANAFLKNLDQSIADLQILSENRFSGGTPEITLAKLKDFYGDNSDDQNNVLSYIIFLERRKEFIIQGLRWFDLKRYNLPVVHDQAGGSAIRLEENDLRKVFQIPKSAVEVGGLKPNPR